MLYFIIGVLVWQFASLLILIWDSRDPSSFEPSEKVLWTTGIIKISLGIIGFVIKKIKLFNFKRNYILYSLYERVDGEIIEISPELYINKKYKNSLIREEENRDYFIRENATKTTFIPPKDYILDDVEKTFYKKFLREEF